MELIISVHKFVNLDPCHLCTPKDSKYKRCSRYVGHLTVKIKELFLAEGFIPVATTSSLTQAEFIFKKDKIYRKIKNILTEGEPTVAVVTVEVEQENLIKVEALLKQLGISDQASSLSD